MKPDELLGKADEISALGKKLLGLGRKEVNTEELEKVLDYLNIVRCRAENRAFELNKEKKYIHSGYFRNTAEFLRNTHEFFYYWFKANSYWSHIDPDDITAFFENELKDAVNEVLKFNS